MVVTANNHAAGCRYSEQCRRQGMQGGCTRLHESNQVPDWGQQHLHTQRCRSLIRPRLGQRGGQLRRAGCRVRCDECVEVFIQYFECDGKETLTRTRHMIRSIRSTAQSAVSPETPHPIKQSGD